MSGHGKHRKSHREHRSSRTSGGHRSHGHHGQSSSSRACESHESSRDQASYGTQESSSTYPPHVTQTSVELTDEDAPGDSDPDYDTATGQWKSIPYQTSTSNPTQYSTVSSMQQTRTYELHDEDAEGEDDPDYYLEQPSSQSYPAQTTASTYSGGGTASQSSASGQASYTPYASGSGSNTSHPSTLGQTSHTTYQATAAAPPLRNVAFSTYNLPAGMSSGYSQSRTPAQASSSSGYYPQQDTNMDYGQSSALGPQSATSGNFGGRGPDDDMTASQGQGSWATASIQTGSSVPGFSQAGCGSNAGQETSYTPSQAADTTTTQPSSSLHPAPVPDYSAPPDYSYKDAWEEIQWPNTGVLRCPLEGCNSQYGSPFEALGEQGMLLHFRQIHGLDSKNWVRKVTCSVPHRCKRYWYFQWSRVEHERGRAHLDNVVKEEKGMPLRRGIAKATSRIDRERKRR
ncbi:hypothetical protein GLAREA_07410 [Glarea lozoyensis ATCC 20868]|uniref:Uncharacterized protein n=1 Tax=Glarea lozoyensis (strain ATCC 20868 / MF5171) TaxID=1116229 RepID=S3D194_GLAL2|nr:uncharacterized protein GLAREA_07410 [Glarea lozoyensis ATCC 20868]EPE32277.1 hypothetical protein GLAREA_07410 [Glarea lozoyensis ATCC 20868]